MGEEKGRSVPGTGKTIRRKFWAGFARGALALALVVAAAVSATVAVAQDGTLDARQEVKIAVLAFRGEEATVRKWQPTVDYLTAQVPGYVFRIVTVSLDEMAAAVKSATVDFILTNPGNYVEHEARHGVVRIATLKPLGFQLAGNRFGAVIFARASDKRIRTLRDLSGKSFMAINEDAFGGFQMAWREMQSQGVDPFDDLAELVFAGFPQDRVVDAVLKGRVDAGTCRTGLLESLADQGKIDMADLRILNPQEVEGFSYALSTRLYPEWPFARLSHTSESLSRQVVIALLGMEVDAPAAVDGGYAGWTVPLDYQPVHELFKELHAGPYGEPVEIRLSDLVEQYWQWGLFAGVLIGVGILWVLRVEHLVSLRTAELSEANALLEKQIVERKRAEDTARARQNELAHIARVNTMGELTASLAHEINQPLSAIANYATGSVRRLGDGRMDEDSLRTVLGTIAGEAQRAGEVIRRVRTFVRKGEVRLEPIDINAIVREAVDITGPEAQRQNVAIALELDGTLPYVTADKVQVEQVLLNLIGNGLEALHDVHDRPRRIVIGTHPCVMDGNGSEEGVKCRVHDTGAGLPPETGEDLFEPFYSTKSDGMGMGLSISRSIIEASGGKLWAEPAVVGGAAFVFTLPKAPAKHGAEDGAKDGGSET